MEACRSRLLLNVNHNHVWYWPNYCWFRTTRMSINSFWCNSISLMTSSLHLWLKLQHSFMLIRHVPLVPITGATLQVLYLLACNFQMSCSNFKIMIGYQYDTRWSCNNCQSHMPNLTRAKIDSQIWLHIWQEQCTCFFNVIKYMTNNSAPSQIWYMSFTHLSAVHSHALHKQAIYWIQKHSCTNLNKHQVTNNSLTISMGEYKKDVTPVR